MRRLQGVALLVLVGLSGACESTDASDAGAVVEAQTLEERTEGWSVEEEADVVLQAAGNLLAQTPRFSFRAEIMEEQVLESGAKIDTSRESSVHVRRPDGVFVERHDATGVRELFYDGSSAAIFDRSANLYVLTDEPPSDLDGFLDYLAETLQVPVPLGDVIVADPYAAMREPAKGGVHFGEALVRGTLCHHLGFGNGAIEWQIWVQMEGRPLIRKAVINYRDEPGSPRWEAHLSDWNLSDDLADEHFTFRPPAGSHRIQLASRDLGEALAGEEEE